jgi:predicted nuclease of predicted toxin-antitoxin system
MKLLFDENLSPRLASRLSDLFPNSLHVQDIGLQSAYDSSIWAYARRNEFLIVSKDGDMHDLSLLHGNPPKVIWLQLGNCSTTQVENLLRRELKTIQTFDEDKSVSLLALR